LQYQKINIYILPHTTTEEGGEENDWNPISTNIKCGPIWSSPHYWNI